MSVKELLKECGFLYFKEDYKNLLIKCEEVLKIDEKNPIALNYKAIAFYYFDMDDIALKILNDTQKLYPKNYYTLSIKSLVYIALKEYRKALDCCNEGLKIKNFDLLEINKIKALIYLDKIDDAYNFYNTIECPNFKFEEILIECEKYSEALNSYNSKLKENSQDLELIDNVKTLMVKYDLNVKPNWDEEFYISWIYHIKHNDNKNCPKCGSKLIPIVYGYPLEEALKQEKNGEIILGGCCINDEMGNLHCPNCKNDFYIDALHIDAKGPLYDYIVLKINNLDELLFDEICCSIYKIREDIEYFDDDEFKAFINHLISIGYLYEPVKGYIKLVDIH
ncbi:hypothetical protein SAMN05216439_0161 [Methanobrevibacter gottschalkii]|uniref:Tetratricopeptide repeat protein n=2 Tax=Methanobrevibacter gottschalkii TaxID=190974 RepID=A0A3N5C1V5_9EURY|nr:MULTISPECIES: hypothetical protein [Methanobrevibacter]MCQ2970793.1 hypothetical protein [archaeon]OEC97273.1 hypothetical protein A9505_05510 [Methanobrevibacter sp. A27]RPF51985.1 hypothetical protein EDC42_1329 [Methanobrevibacter gottschalkii DSM 11977]SEL20994.1 hypothetical protein SAMN05216439_0161 [Methanobrevibacter gottschalkii]